MARRLALGGTAALFGGGGSEAPHSPRTPGRKPERPQIRPEYKVPRNNRRRYAWGGVLTASLLLFCFVLGAVFSFTAPYLIVPLSAPIVALALLCIWALPQLSAVPTRTMRGLFFVFLVSLVVWPNYLAVALPGLPWVTLTRLSAFPMALALLVSLAGSREVRTTLWKTLGSIPALWRLLLAFIAVQTLTLPLSNQLGQSLDKYVQAQVSCTAIFFVSCLVFLKPRAVQTWAVLLWVMAIVVCVLGLWEFRLKHVPWAGHIPSFLKIEDPNVAIALAGVYRLGLQYRIESTFSTSLGFGEYLALCLPFVVHFLISSRRFSVRVAAAASAAFIGAMAVLSGTRLATVSCVLTVLLYLFVVAMRTWRQNKSSLLGPAVALTYPIICTVSVAAILFVGRIRHLVLGNGSGDYSSDARVEQYKLGLPMVLHNPLGHGIGQAATTLGFAPFGFLTIDTYYLSVLLEYGVAGFVVFYSMFGVAIFESGRRALFSPAEGDQAFLTPLALALVNFIVIKSVFSQQDNHPLVFMMLGIVVALVAREKAGAPGKAAVKTRGVSFVSQQLARDGRR